jgi:C_GCAxxG_C_C family probable redox protein
MMDEDFLKMVKYAQQEFYCSQILILMGLDAQGQENPGLVRAMAGLVGGLGFCGKNCGALSGAACLLALYAGKGTPEEAEDSRLNTMIEELVIWFEQEHGSIDCLTILDGDFNNRRERCPQIVYRCYQKVQEILMEYGYNLSGEVED